MPRTKITKKGGGAGKRDRDRDQHDKLIRELDILSENYKYDINFMYDENASIIENLYSNILKQIPKSILSLKMSELKSFEHLQTLDMIKENLLQQQNCDITKLPSFCSNSSAVSHSKLREVGGNGTIRKIVHREDEGYLTEESVKTSANSGSCTSSMLSSANDQSQQHQKPRVAARPIGPLLSAKARSRRSKSTSNVKKQGLIYKNQPILSNSSSNNSVASQQQQNGILSTSKVFGTHLSRSKSRTPLPTQQTQHLQTMSADRNCHLVTPKIQSNAPITLLRYPRQGETVISLSGSPVIAQSIISGTANLNIPCENGIMSVQPTEMSCVDNDFILGMGMDQATLAQLKQIQSNLTKIMQTWRAKQ